MTEKYKVTGMSCAACSARVEKAVGALESVDACTVNLLSGDMLVVGTATRDDVRRAVVKAGYGISEPVSFQEQTDKRGSETRPFVIRLVVSLVLVLILMYIAMGHMAGLPLPLFLEINPLANALLQMLLSAAVMIINYHFFVNGVRGLIRGAPNMDTLVSLGSMVSFGYSVYILFQMTYDALNGGTKLSHYLHGLYFESAAMILALITLGKMLESHAKGKTTDAIKGLIDMSPKTARIIVNGEEQLIFAKELKTGDIFVVRPGEKVPTDGIVLSGISDIDESTLTGESIPVDKSEGSPVYASTVNKSGFITCRATSVGEDTVLSGIIRMVRDATATKAPIAKLADRVSGFFVPLVLCISLLTLAVWLALTADLGRAVSHAIAVLVISCPCALGLATPVAIMVGGGVGAKRGILYKNAGALEMCGKIKTVVLDKTGTVTKGEMSVVDVIAYGIDERELLSLALGLEKMSDHPIADAVVSYAESRGIVCVSVTEFSNLDGRGVYGKYNGCELYCVSLKYAKTLTNIDKNTEELCAKFSEAGKTCVLVVSDGEVVGLISCADSVKDDAEVGIRYLKSRGYRVVMITGDSETVAKSVADSVGIDEVVAGVLPDGKESVVRSLMSEGRVAMVGDGINDAPALTRADVGIAIGRGTDIAIDSADVVLVSGGLLDVAHALDIGRSTLKNIKENLFWAFLYNCIGIPLAAGALGVTLPPMFGAFAMSLSSFSVVMNALRLNLWKPKISYQNKNILPINKEEQIGREEMIKEFTVTGMMCPHCEARVKSVLEQIPGIALAMASHAEKKVTVTLTDNVDDLVIVKAITDAGYKVQ